MSSIACPFALPFRGAFLFSVTHATEAELRSICTILYTIERTCGDGTRLQIEQRFSSGSAPAPLGVKPKFPRAEVRRLAGSGSLRIGLRGGLRHRRNQRLRGGNR